MMSITFTGGLGAQILSASAYFYLKSKNEPVKADFEYFDLAAKVEHLKTLGMQVQNKVSFFNWQLDDLGILQSNFNTIGPETEKVMDGPLKGQLALQGLCNEGIRKLFVIPQRSHELKEELFGKEPFACVHMRRGDYLDVASFVVSDESFFDSIQAISRLVPKLLILSDSPLTDMFKKRILSLGIQVMTGIGGNPSVGHGLMRLSNILITSNSQYSFSAACLRDKNQLTIIPSRHDTGDDPSANEYLNEIRTFQVLTKFVSPRI
jgi:hypothetical protein